MKGKITDADWIEDEMSLTWDAAEGQVIEELPARIKRVYYEQPVDYQDSIQIWALENGKFVVFYSPTGTKYIFATWKEALAFRNLRVAHLKVGYSAFK